MILNDSNNEKKETDEEKNRKITELAKVLSLEDVVLKECKQMSITKSCRKVIKTMYPKRKSRAEQRISKMCRSKIRAIHRKCRITDYNFIINFEYFLGFAKLMHPTQSDTPSYILNNAIGNVFSASKQ